MIETIAILIVLLPLFGSIIGGFGGYVFGDRFAIATTCTLVMTAAVLSVLTYVQIAVFESGAVMATLMPWLHVGGLHVDFGVLLDKLTATMFVVVTVVSACVHVYSIGYMHEDPAKTRFFSYLSLFTFTMLALVSAPNLLQMFLGWEGVGLASYLLIGFWFKKESANAAAMKAFIVNRIADVGLLLAIFTVFITLGSLDYVDIFIAAPTLAEKTFVFLGVEMNLAVLIAALLFIGAMGKSAQFGFHTWLPDAMEGPTPVSALIHAATMVTAGVFLVCRMSPLFEVAPSVLTVVGWVGGFTALFAATIGLTQRDIKRVIAYSTCSQLGYMFFACGVSAYGAAMFHLTTHAFFKALLFLGAGSVIHGVHHQQDMFKMGGLKPYMMVTYALMWIGSLALAGIPPFAGFFSKDLILESAFMAHNDYGIYLYLLGTLAALLTAFYSFRVVFKTFHGPSTLSKKELSHVHEAPKEMMLPMLLLAVGGVFGGFIFHGMADLDWWQGAIFIDPHNIAHVHDIPKLAKYFPLVLACLGIGAAVLVYVRHIGFAEKCAAMVDPLYSWSFNKWYMDEFYDWVVVKNIRRLAVALSEWGDKRGIDALGPNGAAWVAQKVGAIARQFHTGYVYHYAFVMLIGLVGLVTYLISLGGNH